MVNFFRIFSFIITIFLASCSFNNPGDFFTDKTKELEKEVLKKNSKLVFAEEKKFKKEISGLVKGKLTNVTVNSNWSETNFGLDNYVPHLEYNDLKQLTYKSKKIGKNKFKISDLSFEPIIYENNIFFYDPSGNVYRYSLDERNILWKFNFYKKRYKDVPINLKLKISNKNIIVSDNLGYLYSLEIDTGNLNWAKNYGVPFRSTIKIRDENIFLLNQNNKFYIINERDGEKKTSFETFPSILKSELETSMSLDTYMNNLYFITSTGQLYSINYKTRNLNWLLNLSMTNKGQDEKFFFSSPIIYKDDKIFLSTSVSTYSINATNGVINWEIPFSTYIRPVITDNFFILTSKDGFILNLDSKTGKVLWSKNLFKTNKKIKQRKIGSITSLLLVSNKILASTSNGFFLFIDYKDGKIINYAKASKAGFFSNPIIVDKKIHVVDNNLRILIFN
tara:strand:- start:1563 stop:2909 length:1347 start_codon:yes stop_codon:yes gene_type:complete